MKQCWCLVVLLMACSDRKSTEPIPRAKPQPLEPLQRVVADAGDERDAMYRVVPFTPVGPAVPSDAARVELHGETWTPVPAGDAPVLLVSDEDTFLVQAAPLLAQLDDAHREVWLKHPDADIAFQVTLRDAPSFQTWVDEPKPGKVRVIHRADGFEITTNLGKLPGGDPNGPTVPVRSGMMDLTTLQRGLERVQNKFREAPDVCFVPSFGMELQRVARAMSADYFTADQPYFKALCLVYPRPPQEK